MTRLLVLVLIIAVFDGASSLVVKQPPVDWGGKWCGAGTCVNIAQEGNKVTGTETTFGTVGTGTVDGNSITYSWPAGSAWAGTFSGTRSGSTISWQGGGAWSLEALPHPVGDITVSVDVFPSRYKNVENLNPPTHPTRADLVAHLYQGHDPMHLFKNPRSLKFAGDLKWSNVGNNPTDACYLVNLANASFMVEAGCYVGTSTKAWSHCMQQRGTTGVVLAVDTWLGDLATWVEHVDAGSRMLTDDVLRDGRQSLYDQFMLNMQQNNVTNVVPFSATSIIGARWLATMNFVPDLAYIDTAHEEGETAIELELYWRLLKPGGILAGDDYPGWPAVKHDVDAFVARHGLVLQFAPSRNTWFVVKQ